MRCGGYYLEIADQYNVLPALSNLPALLREQYAMFKSALIPPPHMKSSWIWFLVTAMAFNFTLFANLGLSIYEQVVLVNDFDHSAQDTAWPPIITGLTGMATGM